MHRAVEREVQLDVPLERVDHLADPADAPLEARRVGDLVGDHVPVAGRRLRLRAVGPELGERPGVVAAQHDVRLVRLAGGRVDVVAVAVVGRRACCRRARPGRCRSRRRRTGRARCCRRSTSTAACLNASSAGRIAESRRRTGIDRQRLPRTAAWRTTSTWPQCGPMIVCTVPGIGSPFWAICSSSASGCHALGSFITVPGSRHEQRVVDRRRSCCRRSARSRARRRRAPYSMTAAAMRLPSAAGESPSVESKSVR